MVGDAERFSDVRGLGDVGVSQAPEQRPEAEPCGKGFQEGGTGTKARGPHWHCLPSQQEASVARGSKQKKT